MSGLLQSAPIQIGPSEWRVWRQNPVTQAFFQVLQTEGEILQTALLEGDTLTGGMESALVATAKIIGAVQAYKTALFGVEEELRLQWQEAEEAGKEKENG